MEFFTAEFLSALFAIIVIDLVLAGDNAIVIALAARNLPKHLQKQAIVWGAVGAVSIRSLLTIAVVWLLRVPGLMLIGGVLLVWIGYKLLLPEEPGDNGEAKVSAAGSFWGAIRTIVVADMVMGLDNVLAVAGAAHGNYMLVVLGLLISVPIVVWGSSLLLGFVERFPAVVYVGAGVLAWTAAKMITSEPYLKDAFAAYDVTVPLTFAVIVGGVLWAGFRINHRVKVSAAVDARVQPLEKQPQARQGASEAPAMPRILVPVDGTGNAAYAVRHAMKHFEHDHALDIHLLNVQAPFSMHVALFSSRSNRDEFHREQAEKALKPVRALLQSRGVPFVEHLQVGPRAESIAEAARRLQCDHILMSTSRKNSLTRMLEDSVTNKVLELTTVPVEVVSGSAVSKWERYGLPAGISVALALLLFIEH